MGRHILLNNKTLMICVLSGAVLLCGCSGKAGEAGAADAAEVSADITETIQEEAGTGKTEAVKEENAGETVTKPEDETGKGLMEEWGTLDAATDYEALYEPVFREVLEVIDNGYDYEKEYKYISDGLMEKTMYPGDKDLHESVGYLLEDISGDGVPELVIGSDEDWGGRGPESLIYSIFSVKDDKPFCVLEGWARNSYYMLDNGHLYNCGSGGAAITILGECHLSTDGLEIIWDDFYFTDEKQPGQIGKYHNTYGLFDPKSSEEMNMTDDEFFDIMESYTKKFKLIPWTPIGSHKSAKTESRQTGGSDKDYKADDHEFSFKDTIFTIDGHDIDVRDEIALTDSILDAKRIGNWIILDCHVNPHFGVYEFYNINSGSFEYDVQGANLTWRDDDLSTAVYSMYNEVFDLWGHLIGRVHEGEVFGLEWIDDETVGANCLMIDAAGQEKEFTQKFECISEDRAVLSYYEYLTGGKSDPKKLTDGAPSDAVALLIVNPPERVLKRLPAAQVYDKGGYDRVVVVSLRDGEKLRIDPNDTYVPGHEKNDAVNETDLGGAVVYQMTVPEGAPNSTLVVSVPGEKEVTWDIITLSGRSAVMSKFLTAGGSN